MTEQSSHSAEGWSTQDTQEGMTGDPADSGGGRQVMLLLPLFMMKTGFHIVHLPRGIGSIFHQP